MLVYTLRVAWYAARAGKWRMIPAVLLHDIGKPVVAYQKPEDVEKTNTASPTTKRSATTSSRNGLS